MTQRRPSDHVGQGAALAKPLSAPVRSKLPTVAKNASPILPFPAGIRPPPAVSAERDGIFSTPRRPAIPGISPPPGTTEGREVWGEKGGGGEAGGGRGWASRREEGEGE